MLWSLSLPSSWLYYLSLSSSSLPLLRELRFVACFSATTSESKEGSKGAPMGSALDSWDVISTDSSVGISAVPFLPVKNNNIIMRRIKTESKFETLEIYYILEEADQCPTADEEDCCWISSSFHGRHLNFPPSPESRHSGLDSEG